MPFWDGWNISKADIVQRWWSTWTDFSRDSSEEICFTAQVWCPIQVWVQTCRLWLVSDGYGMRVNHAMVGRTQQSWQGKAAQLSHFEAMWGAALPSFSPDSQRWSRDKKDKNKTRKRKRERGLKKERERKRERKKMKKTKRRQKQMTDSFDDSFSTFDRLWPFCAAWDTFRYVMCGMANGDVCVWGATNAGTTVFFRVAGCCLSCCNGLFQARLVHKLEGHTALYLGSKLVAAVLYFHRLDHAFPYFMFCWGDVLFGHVDVMLWGTRLKLVGKPIGESCHCPNTFNGLVPTADEKQHGAFTKCDLMVGNVDWQLLQ